MGEAAEADEFEALGRAVARVLREAFATAEGIRSDAVPDAAALHDELDGPIADAMAGARELPSSVRREAEAMREALRATADEAAQAVTALIGAAQAEATTIRTQAFADARAIVASAEAQLAGVAKLLDEERSKVRAELEALVQGVGRSVAALRHETERDVAAGLERASGEAAVMLRQARLHHRHTAREVDRMIEAAATEASALRAAAMEDADRIMARVSGVVQLPEPVVEAPPAQRVQRRRAG